LDAGFTGRQPLDAALEDYHRRRDAAVRPMYDFTCQLAALDRPPPDMQRLFIAVAGDQLAADRFVGTIAGTVSIPEFFSEASLRRMGVEPGASPPPG